MWYFTYDGTTYPFDGKLWVPESQLLKEKLGLNPLQWRAALADWDGDALWAMWVILRARNGDPVEDWDEEAKSFNVFGISVDDDETKDAEGEPDAEVPTLPDPDGQ